MIDFLLSGPNRCNILPGIFESRLHVAMLGVEGLQGSRVASVRAITETIAPRFQCSPVGGREPISRPALLYRGIEKFWGTEITKVLCLPL
jgi:hypothetical protein